MQQAEHDTSLRVQVDYELTEPESIDEERLLCEWCGRRVYRKPANAGCTYGYIVGLVIVGAIATGQTWALATGRISWQRSLLFYALDLGVAALCTMVWCNKEFSISRAPMATPLLLVEARDNERL